MTKAGKQAQQAVRFKTIEDDNKEIEEARVRLAAAKEIRMDAAVAAALSKERH